MSIETIAGFGVLAVAVYYLLVWMKYGVDPPADSIPVRYSPPRGFSPAMMRYLRNMEFDDRVLMTALFSLRAKGYIFIDEVEGNVVLQKCKGALLNCEALTNDEQLFWQSLMFDEDNFVLNQMKFKVSSGVRDLKKAVATATAPFMFSRYKLFFLGGVLLSTAVLGAMVFVSGVAEERSLFIGFVWMAGFVAAVAAAALYLAYLYLVWRRTISGMRDWWFRSNSDFSWVGMLFLASVGIIPVVFTAMLVAEQFRPVVSVTIASLITLNAVFFHLLKAPTQRGREALDEIEGFRVFLAATEAERLTFQNPPDRTPELFHRYVPHAFALGVERHWSNAFETTVSDTTAVIQDHRFYYLGTLFGYPFFLWRKRQ